MTKKRKIHSIQILGERCSGTNFLESIIRSYVRCRVTPTVGAAAMKALGHKHFFGFNNEAIHDAGKNHLCVTITRNAYDWMSSFYRHAWHIPYENIIDIESYLHNEWYSVWYSTLTTQMQNQKGLKKKNLLRLKKEILQNTLGSYVDGPEIMEDRDYSTNNRYRNIFHLRQSKIVYLYSILPQIASNVIHIQYEEINKNPGIILEKFSQYDINLRKNAKLVQSKNTKPYNLDPYLKESVDKRLLWQTETLVGYTKNA